ncbi:maltotransferase domain-containing protein, partial [Streptomyces viridosporus]|uniref:maltotransferase domain-containing protein n=1 Tax=Streptomyces viridosporus TaxID=67581 RepID=UPI00332E153F
MPAKHHSSSPPTPGARTPSKRGAGNSPPRPADAGPASPPGPTPTNPGAAPATAVGRIPVLDVRPMVQQGRRPAKAVVGETFEVTATVFREGHDAVAANVVL